MLYDTSPGMLPPRQARSQGSVRYWSPQLALLKDARDEHGEAVLGVSCAPSLLKFATASKDSTLKVLKAQAPAVVASALICSI